MEQSEQDFRDIERAHELPPDEPYPGRPVECPECSSENVDVSDEDETMLECLTCGHSWKDKP